MALSFSQLSNLHRSALAALVNTGPLNTDQLAKCMQLGSNAAAAANSLNALRELGLIYSHQKSPGQLYCQWKANQIGVELFNARPDAALRITMGTQSEYISSLEERVSTLQDDLQAKVDKACGSIKQIAQLEKDNARLRDIVNQRRVKAADCQRGPTKFAVVTSVRETAIGTREQAIMSAQHAALETGQAYTVIGLVAEVTPPEKPMPVVELL